MTSVAARPVGDYLREWRQRRRLSQLELATEAEISARHLSFLETGRSLPSRDMVLHLAERLDVPLRERNVMLVAAGYAPVFPERTLQDPALAAARQAIDALLASHEPYPALAIDRHWTLLSANTAAARLMAGADAELLKPPVNVLRLSLNPKGLAPRIVNLAEWRAHLIERLRRQIDVTADAVLGELLHELCGYGGGASSAPPSIDRRYAGIIVPLRLRTETGVLSFLSTTTVFGTPVDILLSEIALETFFPADEETARALRETASSLRGA
ncbi:MAG TPA: helix-turn-helix transcriptional regulator [Xanthobacteraceae bacterium]|nr:helix-turn-helix transcriptional regulator [Xanthobacteraceae bacterium]